MTRIDGKYSPPVLAAILCVLALSGIAGGTGLEIEQDWVLVDSINASIRIPAGETCEIIFVNSSGTLAFNPPDDGLTSLATSAVAVAPDWLQTDLADNFSRLSSSYQDVYANMILGASDPYVDEIAFEVAHLAPQTLGSSLFEPDILTYNVTLLYENDPHLAYADIVNYGSASGGGDYYSTISYTVYEDPDTLYLELPKEIYYWFVVHPKLHRERPDYINPATGAHADPPIGVFWRDYLFNHADTGYPLLRDSLEVCTTLWNCDTNSLDNGAIGALTQWITTVMVFQSHPHHNQPVRIYHWHEGTCSVHSYLNSAASRTALIPATISVMYRNDHKINEFWERQWIAWEPVGTHINDPRVYDPGWGWDIASVFDWRGDGYTWNVTERYTDVCTLTVSVVDAVGNPVDGACIVLDSDGVPGPRCLADYTSSTGVRQYLFGDSRLLKAKVMSPIGNYPPTGYYTISVSTVTGQHYTMEVSLSGEIIDLDMSPATPPGSPTDDYLMVVEIEVPEETVYGTNLDDSDVFSESEPPGNVDFFICDEANYVAYEASSPFEAYEISEDTSGVDTDFTIPTDEQYHAVISNESSLFVTQRVNVSIKLYEDQTGIAGGPEAAGPSGVYLHRTWPNPFSVSTSISYTVSGLHAADVTIEVYDMHGRVVRRLTDELQMPGSHFVTWDGTDGSGVDLPPGVYFCRGMADGGGSSTTRMVLLR